MKFEKSKVVADGTIPQKVMDQVACLLQTPVGTCGLDRGFGIDWSFLDLPTPAAKAAYIAEIAEKIMHYVPEARVVRVTWKDTMDAIHPKVVIQLV